MFVLAASNAEGAEVQLADRAGRSVAQGIVGATGAANRRPGRGGGPGHARAGAAPLGDGQTPALGPVGVVVGATAEHGLDLSTRPVRYWHRASARRAPPRGPGVRFAGVRGVVPTASRSVLAAGLDPAASGCSAGSRGDQLTATPGPCTDPPHRSHDVCAVTHYLADGGTTTLEGPPDTNLVVTEDPVDVLIVDDQRPFRSVARTVVGLVGGWRVAAEAETGEDAVAAAERVRPGVVLMDINLPGISGIEATRRIVASHPETTVVLLSTYAAADLPSEATTCGAATYLNKEDLCPATPRACGAAAGGGVLRPPVRRPRDALPLAPRPSAERPRRAVIQARRVVVAVRRLRSAGGHPPVRAVPWRVGACSRRTAVLSP